MAIINPPEDFSMDFKAFNNLKIGAKIIGGYLVALTLMVVVGGLAIVRLNELDVITNYLSGDLAKDRQLGNDVETQILLVRFFANKYINTHDPANLDRYKEEATKLDEFLAQASATIVQPEWAALVKQIETDWAQYKQAMGEVQTIIGERDRIQTEALDVQGPLALAKLDALGEATQEADDATATFEVGRARRSFLIMRLEMFRYLARGDAQIMDQEHKAFNEAKTALDKLDAHLQDPAQRQLLAEATTAVTAYDEASDGLKFSYERQQDLQTNTLDVLGPDIRQIAAQIVEQVGEAYAAESQGVDELVKQTQTTIIVVTIVAVLAALGVGLLISRAITGPLNKVAQAAASIADGDLDQHITITARDEVGQMAQAFGRMIEYLKAMAGVAGKVAEGDLTETVTPKSEKDMLGVAFAGMVANLRQQIGAVSDNASNVSAAAQQLTTTAEQSGQATAQISTTVQQVARGTAQQTENITRTATSVEQMKRAIEGVAKGAQEQAGAVSKASSLTAQMSASIQQVNQNSQAVARDAAQASESARAGAQAVSATVQGMQTIKDKVDVSGQKVREMGDRSEQIGQIIETIDDIAAQTNLLALNAAIEAARAGEHGKGFAVVAEEVRKLAEKSAVATKEIAGLIQGIQSTVKEAAAAMAEGMQEVEAGVALANRSGVALEEILQVVGKVTEQAKSTLTAAQTMQVASNELVGAMDSMSAVVEENTAATEEMAAGSTEVTQAIENIASISEENSAAAEEVSASTEEVSAQVEEVSGSAQSLAEMAQALQSIVGQFKLSETQAALKPAVLPTLAVTTSTRIDLPERKLVLNELIPRVTTKGSDMQRRAG
jgi:methyl-accepting chemotaxis protein